MYALIKTPYGEHEVKDFADLTRQDQVVKQYEYEWEAEEHADYLNQQAWKRAEDDAQREAWQIRQFS